MCTRVLVVVSLKTLEKAKSEDGRFLPEEAEAPPQSHSTTRARQRGQWTPLCEWLGHDSLLQAYLENTLLLKNAETSTKTSKHNIKGHWSQITMRNVIIIMKKFENATKLGIPVTVLVMVKSNNALKQECTLQAGAHYQGIAGEGGNRCSPGFSLILRNCHSRPKLQQPPLSSVSSRQQ